MNSKYRLLLASAIALLSCLLMMTFFTAPVLAQDRVFLDLSLEFLGDYQLPKINFEDTPVGEFSAITYNKRRDRFYALSSDNQFAPARFYTLKLTPNSTSEEIGIHKIDVESVTLLKDKDGQTLAKGTITPRGIALTPQQTVFISGYGVSNNRITPFIQEFIISTGKPRIDLPIPERYFPDTEKQESSKGIQEAGAFASLTTNPTGTVPSVGEPIRLFTATETALVQDKNLSEPEKNKCRFLHYLIGYGPPVLISEYFYSLEASPSDAISNSLEELISVDQGGHFFSLEQSKNNSGFSGKIFQMTTGGATDTSRIESLKGEIRGVKPLKKKLLLDLNKLGMPLENIQAMTLGPRLSDGTQSLLLVSNNNFNEEQATHFLLFRLKNSMPSRRAN